MSQVTMAGSVAADSRSPRATCSASARAVAPPTGSSGWGPATTRTWCGPCPTDSIRIGRPARDIPIRRSLPTPGNRETNCRADPVTSAPVG